MARSPGRHVRRALLRLRQHLGEAGRVIGCLGRRPAYVSAQDLNRAQHVATTVERSQTAVQGTDNPSIVSRISNPVVQMMSAYTGRGPRRHGPRWTTTWSAW